MSENCPTQPDDSGATRVRDGDLATLTDRRRIVESDYSAIQTGLLVEYAAFAGVWNCFPQSLGFLLFVAYGL
jgi:hypothetical protein